MLEFCLVPLMPRSAHPLCGLGWEERPPAWVWGAQGHTPVAVFALSSSGGIGAEGHRARRPGKPFQQKHSRFGSSQ